MIDGQYDKKQGGDMYLGGFLRCCGARCAMLWRNIVWVFALCPCAVLPSPSLAQVIQRGESTPPVDFWYWAKSDQKYLSIIALDAKRQQAVIKIDGGRLIVTKRGAAIPGFSVYLAGISGSTAVFQPLATAGEEKVDRISITLLNGSQITSIARLQPPARSSTGGWVILP